MEKVDDILILTTWGTILIALMVLANCLLVALCRCRLKKQQAKAYQELARVQRLSSVSTIGTARVPPGAGNLAGRRFADDLEKPRLDIYSTNKKKRDIEDLEYCGSTPSSKFGTADKFVEGVEMQELERPDRWTSLPATTRNVETDRNMVSEPRTPG